MRNIILLALFWASIGLSSSLIAATKNIVLFVADDYGRDAGCYGNPVIKTPSLDRLAAEGTRFEFAFCTTASCSASRAVILTGLHNHANGQYGHEHAEHHFRTMETAKTLPVLLSEAGYRTARVGKFHVGPAEVYKFDEVLGANAQNPVAMADACKPMISAKDSKPFFLYFCTVDPHRLGGPANELPHSPDRFGNKPPGQQHAGVTEVKYDPKEVVVPPFLPDSPPCRAELAQYYQSVSRMDQGLGRLVEHLKAAGVYDDTLIAFISDNGIAFPGAKTTAYEPGIRVPCVVRNPYAKHRGLVTRAMVSWVDITPTLLDFAGADAAKSPKFHGRSFLSVLEEEHPEGWDEVFASHTFHEVTMYYPMRVLRERRYKLIWNIAHVLPFPFASDLWESVTWQGSLKQSEGAMYGRRTVGRYIHRPEFELYDLESDPDETGNLADDPAQASRLMGMKEKLRAFQKRTRDPWILKWERE